MRFIQKTASPDFFEQEKANFPLSDDSPWEDLKNPCKKQLHQFLQHEQQGLCGYCERELTADAHLEHIAPRERYPALKFDYHNLIVSCNGQFLCENKLKRQESCGHRKSNEYDPPLFLNPTTCENISHHFAYNGETGAITPAPEPAAEAAAYMIRILNLDVSYLRDARLNAKKALLHVLQTLPPEQVSQIIRQELAIEREFSSFLRAYFAPFLE